MLMNTISQRLLISTLLLFSSASSAELNGVSPGGFSTSHSMTTAADSAAVYHAITENIAQWWEASHSWSGDAANLYFDARLGGCFCEKLPNGGAVEHLRIIYLAPEKEIRMRGSLGPLQQMGLRGAMTWKLETVEGGTSITFEYIVNGYMAEGGFEGLAPAVDGVIGAQLQGLVTFLSK